MFEIQGKYTKAKIMIDDVESSCVSQIYSFVNHVAFTNPIAIMPDTHAGKGSVIGFTMEMTDKVIPNVIGVDIGCGMRSCNIGKQLNISLEDFDRKIRQRIPFGQNTHEETIIHMKNDFPWHEVTVSAQHFFNAYAEKFGFRYETLKYDIDWFTKKCEAIGGNLRRIINGLGTLGGGNHFIETGISTNDDVWITIHSGSRNFGKRICEYWQNKAIKKFKHADKDEIKTKIDALKKQYSGDELYHKIQEVKNQQPSEFKCSEELRWLEGEDAAGYLSDMIFSQMYAEVNRKYMMKIILDILKVTPIETIETVHNFIDFHDFIIRKGAIRSYSGEKMIIPFNMKDGILICEGKSNAEWNCSAPHGAGRVLSRSQAKKALNLADFKEQMKDIYTTSVGQGTLDEAPNAYKDSKIIEEAIQPTAIILDRIRPIHNMKDSLGDEENHVL